MARQPLATTAFQFTGRPGQRLGYDALNAGSISATARLIGPDASQLGVFNIDQDGEGTVSLGGTHYVLLSSNVNAAANYKFRLSDENAAPAIVFGRLVEQLLSEAGFTDGRRTDEQSEPGQDAVESAVEI